MADTSNSTIDRTEANGPEWAAAFAHYLASTAAAQSASNRTDLLDRSFESMKPIEPKPGIAIQSRGQCFSFDDASRNAIAGREAWLDACANLRGLIGLNDASEECDRLWSIQSELETQLIRMPAPDLAALEWKLSVLLSDDGDGWTSSWSADFVAQARADIARFAAQ